MRIFRLLAIVLVSALSALLPNTAMSGPFDALQAASNPAHTPVVTAPAKVAKGEAFEVTVSIGTKPHPTDTSHFIRYIALYAGEVELARVSLTPTLTVPTVTFTIKLEKSTTLRALAAPNHSAAWVTEHPVSVH